MRLFSCILLFIFFTLFPALKAQEKNGKLTLENIFARGTFATRSVQNIRSLKDGNNFTVLQNGRRIIEYTYASGSYISMLLDMDILPEAPFSMISEYELSPDETKILLATNREDIYRNSFSADYYLYDRASGSLMKLSDHGRQRLATFSPDSRKIAFVRDNNIFVTDLTGGSETQVTFDGKSTMIINGAPDWVYEEEFTFTRAFEWSPDSKKIAYYRFDESSVKQYELTLYNGLYPDHIKYKYPKAGEKNSVVAIRIYDLSARSTRNVDTGDETDQYIPRIRWTKDPSVLSITRLNRLQDHLEILHADAASGKVQVVYEETEDKYISEATADELTYLDSGKEFIITSERDGWRHLYVFDFMAGKLRLITDGPWDISEYLGYDRSTGRIFYTSHERSPLEQDVYSISKDGRNKKRLSEGSGWNDAAFNKTSGFYINTWSDINTPPRTTLNSSDGRMVRILEDNSEIKKDIKTCGFTPAEFFTCPSSGKDSLYGYIIKPPDFREENIYPLFMYVYGGPESQDVKNEYFSRMPWFQLLAKEGYVVACVANRGTDGRGEDFRKATYLQLGRIETDDQIAAARYLGTKPWIDGSRTGIFGWSYGGFMTLSCLLKGNDVFKMGIAVAPVTNWRFYDTIYTERFMRTPRENPEGYDRNSPVNFASGLKGKLLLIHGMADDNVHLQNSAEMIRAFIRNNRDFEMQFYPDKDHSINGGNTPLHLYRRMTGFIEENL